jgi:hypothetical protein
MGAGFYSALSHKGKNIFSWLGGFFAAPATIAGVSRMLGSWSFDVEKVWTEL